MVIGRGSRLHFTGGRFDGDIIVQDAQINIESSVTHAAFIRVLGPYNLLVNNASGAVTLLVQGCAEGGGDAVLTTGDLSVNVGRIVLARIAHRVAAEAANSP